MITIRRRIRVPARLRRNFRRRLVQDYRALRVWRLSHALTIDVHRPTQVSARRGNYALVSQLRRAAMSVGANIVEGCGCTGSREFARFLQIAAASAYELEYHLLLARDLGVIPAPEALRLGGKATSLKRMITVLIRRVREGATAPSSVARSALPEPSTDDRIP